jgi:hypothetical protein
MRSRRKKPQKPLDKVKAILYNADRRNEREKKMDYLATYTNTDHGTEARILESPRGYHVTLWDLDAGEALPVANIFPHTMDGALAKAHAKAKDWANI